VVTEGMAQPPVSKKSIAIAAVRAIRNNLRPMAEERSRPQLEIPSQDAQWFILSRLDSATVGTADGRGVTLRRRNPAVFWRLAKSAVRLNLEIARRFPQATVDYRGAYGELTSAENWQKAFTQ
jgi:galactofuranosylgalactofuranosylrhamnosyl-N-acetylglucosaminyl-diphospho-decaprenol beta-1,5/1,6-galactofuranosyltransferase